MASSDPDGVVDTLTALTVLPDRGGKTRYAFELSGNSAGPSSPPLYTYTRARSFGVLVERALSSVCHSKEVMLLQIASYIVIAMLVGMYSHSHDIGNDAAKVLKNVGCIFFTILFAVLIGTMPTILTFPRQVADFVRQNRSSKHAMTAIYVARVLIDLPFHFLFSSIYAIFIYAMTSQPLDRTRLLRFSSICVMTSLVSYSLGLLIAVELSGKPTTTRSTVPLVISVPVVLFAGFVMDFYLLPNYIKWLSWISYVRYAFNGALIGIYGFGRENLNCSNAYCHYKNPQTILIELSIEEDSYFEDAGALVYVFVALQIFAFSLLLRKMRSNR